jgi:hypothetical protein
MEPRPTQPPTEDIFGQVGSVRRRVDRRNARPPWEGKGMFQFAGRVKMVSAVLPRWSCLTHTTLNVREHGR